MRGFVVGSIMLLGLAGAIVLGPDRAGARAERNPSPYQSRTEAFAEARKLKVEGAIEVIVMTGVKDRSVTLTGPPELLADAETRVEDGVLTIGFRDATPWSWNPGSGMTVAVSIPVLEGIETHGPARVNATTLGRLVPSFSAAVNGAGKIDIAQLKADRVQLAIGGAGSIRVDGAASDVAYAIGGSGSIDAKRLRAAKGAISIGGAGSVFADISGAAQINIGGPGTVEVVGGAACTTRAARPGQVDCR